MIEPREVMRKIRPGLASVDLTMDERSWLTDVLERVSAAQVVVDRIPTDHPEFDGATRTAYLAGILGHVLDGWRRGLTRYPKGTMPLL